MQSGKQDALIAGQTPALKWRASLFLVLLYPIPHFITVWLGGFFSASGFTATLWVSNALLLSALLILERRWWLWLVTSMFIADLLAIITLYAHMDFVVLLFYSAANILEALFAALLLSRFCSRRFNISRLRDCVFFSFVAALLAPAFGGLIAAYARLGAGDLVEFLGFWQIWWAANALGILVFVPVIVSWTYFTRQSLNELLLRKVEMVVLTLLVIALCVGMFSAKPGTVNTILGLPYVIYPLMIWAALRFGPRISATLLLVVAVIAVTNTNSGNGPFAMVGYTVYQSVLSLQMFLAVAAISSLLLGAAFSERQFARRSHRGSEEKFASAFNSTSEAICICRVSDGRILEVNEGFEVLTGHMRSEVLGASLKDLGLLPIEMQRGKYLNEQLNTPLQVNTVMPLKSGQIKDCTLVTDLAEIGDDTCMVAVLHDLTSIRAAEEKRRSLEMELMRAQRMETVGLLTSGITHDFNNILSALVGFTTLAGVRADELEDTKLQSYLGEVQNAIARARELITHLLAFSRQGTIHKIPVEISALVDETMRLLKPIMPASLRINTDAYSTPVYVLSNLVQLQQIVLNLCINARDATGGVGQIDIHTGVVNDIHSLCSSCQQLFEGAFACVTVSDNGTGVSAHSTEKIFDPFYTSKDAGKGTGLGLSVVHGIVHEHGGHIVVDNRLKGASFSIYLPQASEKDTVQATESMSRSELEMVGPLNGKILAVDDDVTAGALTDSVLKESGLDVTVVNSSIDALTLFQSDPDRFDLVITDNTMPHLSGTELAERLMAIRPDLPVIMCSGNELNTDVSMIRKLGIRGYYPKPVEFPRLLQQIERLLRNG